MTAKTLNPPAPYPVDLDSMEREIRRAANGIVSSARTRRDHPTYGVTKTSLRRDETFLRGLVAMYAFATRQTGNASGINPLDVRFCDKTLRGRLLDVRDVLADL